MVINLVCATVCVAGFPQLYMHMFAQRRKIIGGDEQRSKRD